MSCFAPELFLRHSGRGQKYLIHNRNRIEHAGRTCLQLRLQIVCWTWLLFSTLRVWLGDGNWPSSVLLHQKYCSNVFSHSSRILHLSRKVYIIKTFICHRRTLILRSGDIWWIHQFQRFRSIDGVWPKFSWFDTESSAQTRFLGSNRVFQVSHTQKIK